MHGLYHSGMILEDYGIMVWYYSGLSLLKIHSMVLINKMVWFSYHISYDDWVVRCIASHFC